MESSINVDTNSESLFDPFTEQVAGRYFVGREEQLQQFQLSLNGLRQGMPNHMYVTGIHGTGKTSLLTKLAEMSMEQGFAASPSLPTLDANALAHEHVSTILRNVIHSVEMYFASRQPPIVVGLLQDWDLGSKSTLFSHRRNERLESDRIRHDFEMLRDRMREAKIPGAVICIDEGQRIDALALSAIKNALQNLNGFLIVLSLRVVGTGDALAAGRVLLDDKGKQAEGDFGASRFFVTGVSTGPFASEDESVDCIRRRLEGNPIQFEEATMRTIGRITGRVPRDMISMSSNLYTTAASKGLRLVPVSLLNEVFSNIHRVETAEAKSLYESVSTQARSALSGLVALRGAARADLIADHVFPGTPPEPRSLLIKGVAGELDRLCEATNFCRKTEEVYEIPDPVRAYALELSVSSK